MFWLDPNLFATGNPPTPIYVLICAAQVHHPSHTKDWVRGGTTLKPKATHPPPPSQQPNPLGFPAIRQLFTHYELIDMDNIGQMISIRIYIHQIINNTMLITRCQTCPNNPPYHNNNALSSSSVTLPAPIYHVSVRRQNNQASFQLYL